MVHEADIAKLWRRLFAKGRTRKIMKALAVLRMAFTMLVALSSFAHACHARQLEHSYRPADRKVARF